MRHIPLIAAQGQLPVPMNERLDQGVDVKGLSQPRRRGGHLRLNLLCSCSRRVYTSTLTCITSISVCRFRHLHKKQG
eukprot:4275371-Amphidinium_carterae.1